MQWGVRGSPPALSGVVNVCTIECFALFSRDSVCDFQSYSDWINCSRCSVEDGPGLG